MSRAVLDASAVLAVLFRELGHEKAADRASGGLISAVNFAEVASKMAERGFNRRAVVSLIDQLNAEIVDFDAEQALRVGELRPVTAKAGLSLGDRACLALAEILDRPLVTADRDQAGAAGALTVDLIR